MAQENEFEKLFNYPDGQVLVLGYRIEDCVRFKFMSSVGIENNKLAIRIIYFDRDEHATSDWYGKAQYYFNSLTAETALQVFE